MAYLLTYNVFCGMSVIQENSHLSLPGRLYVGWGLLPFETSIRWPWTSNPWPVESQDVCGFQGMLTFWWPPWSGVIVLLPEILFFQVHAQPRSSPCFSLKIMFTWNCKMLLKSWGRLPDGWHSKQSNPSHPNVFSWEPVPDTQPPRAPWWPALPVASLTPHSPFSPNSLPHLHVGRVTQLPSPSAPAPEQL